MPDYVYEAPVHPGVVRDFVNAERELIIRDLESVRKAVTDALAGQPVYKIYGRDEKQGGDPIKHRRKIRLKFNKHFRAPNPTAGSLWTVPDIIGFTVVVAYPSDISAICKVVDKLIDDGILLTSATDDIKDDEESDQAEGIIVSRHGRPIDADGYFACHYNLRIKSVNRWRPLCELQIKTVLHDAWGAKTHDLTYKPSGKISADLVKSFNLMGDTLAKIDQQSDLVRNSIQRSAAPRNRKKHLVRMSTLTGTAKEISQTPELTEVYNRIASVTVASTEEDIHQCKHMLLDAFKAHPSDTCYLYALLAMNAGKEDLYQLTLDALDTVFEDEKDVFLKVRAKTTAAVVTFTCGDMPHAVEYCEEALRLASSLDSAAMDADQLVRKDRLLNSICSTLGYYHADMIGSHDGTLDESHQKAVDFLNMCEQFRASVGLPAKGILATNDEILTALDRADAKQFRRVFQSLENEAFIRIQTATTEEELRAVWNKLEVLKSTKPQDVVSAAHTFDDYHDYCARVRLAELETQ
jgi:ppGpp synthetase/RelA/SpoT-type nucleotidyltranferase